MSAPFRRTRIAAAVGGILMLIGASQAFGTGFQLNENSASSLGNAFAGGAAFTDDVSAMWWNPAALSQFPRIQGALAVHLVTPSIKFHNDASQAAANQPLGHEGGDAGGNNFIPNAYLSVPINPQWTFGLGVNAPFGLVTEYGDGWLGRYQALKSDIETINVNPAISWRVAPNFAIGAGANWQRIKATLTNNVNYSGAIALAAQQLAAAGQLPPALIQPIILATPGLDSKASADADDDTWGWNIGVAWDVTPQFRLGAGYRSEMKYHLSGNIDFSNPTPAPPPGTPAPVVGAIGLISAGLNATRLYSRGISADVTVPQIVNVSMRWQVDPKWEILADAQWTGWSSLPELKLVPNDGSTLDALALNWDDSWKFSVGASYRYNEQWKARVGVAFDQTPVTDQPTARLPDSDRWWLGIGGEWKPNPNWKLDAGFVYIFADSPNFNQNRGSTTANGLINGSYDVSTTIFSMQATYTF